jgi:endo-1,4-beta-xylanase
MLTRHSHLSHAGNGPKTCIAGWICVYSNPYYSQCLQAPLSSTSKTTSSTRSSTTASSTTSKSSSSSTVSSTSSTTKSSSSSTVTSTVSSTSSTPVPSPTGLNLAAKAAGKLYLGSATDNPELSDATYVSLLSNSAEFGQLTPGNSMKWDATEPSRGTFTFSGGDAIADLAKKNGQLLRGHTCVWHNQLPSWLTNGKWSKSELLSIVENHCSKLIGHYKGQM